MVRTHNLSTFLVIREKQIKTTQDFIVHNQSGQDEGTTHPGDKV